MTAIIDYTNVATSVLVQDILQAGDSNVVLDESFVRHMVLNTIRSYVVRYKHDGNVILATDGRYTWRRKFFAPYKAKRKEAKEQSLIDWNMVHQVTNEIREDLKNFFPVKVIHHENLEADDIIGSFVMNREPGDEIVIVSSDKDFKQLHGNGVTQFSPTKKEDVTVEDPSRELGELVLKGDAGDGVPSMISPDDVFVEGIRQSPVTSKMKDEFFSYWNNFELDPKFFDDYESGKIWTGTRKKGVSTETLLTQYNRNKTLVDLRQTPTDLKANVLDQMEVSPTGNAITMLQYFGRHNMKRLSESVGDWL